MHKPHVALAAHDQGNIVCIADVRARLSGGPVRSGGGHPNGGKGARAESPAHSAKVSRLRPPRNIDMVGG